MGTFGDLVRQFSNTPQGQRLIKTSKQHPRASFAGMDRAALVVRKDNQEALLNALFAHCVEYAHSGPHRLAPLVLADAPDDEELRRHRELRNSIRSLTRSASKKQQEDLTLEQIAARVRQAFLTQSNLHSQRVYTALIVQPSDKLSDIRNYRTGDIVVLLRPLKDCRFTQANQWEIINVNRTERKIMLRNKHGQFLDISGQHLSILAFWQPVLDLESFNIARRLQSPQFKIFTTSETSSESATFQGAQNWRRAYFKTAKLWYKIACRLDRAKPGSVAVKLYDGRTGERLKRRSSGAGKIYWLSKSEVKGKASSHCSIMPRSLLSSSQRRKDSADSIERRPATIPSTLTSSSRSSQ
jgi:hypothetical protein